MLFGPTPAFKESMRANISLAVIWYIIGGLMLWWVYNQQKDQYKKENINFTIELRDSAHEASIFKYQKLLENQAFVKPQSVVYISKEKGLQRLSEQLNDSTLLKEPFNPLPNTIQFNMRGSALNHRDSLAQQIRKEAFVQDIYWAEELARRPSFPALYWAVIGSIIITMLHILAWGVMQSYLQQKLQQKQSFINVMQYAGATLQKFQRPYLKQSIQQGLLSSGIAFVILYGSLFFIELEVINFHHNPSFYLIILLVTIGSILLCFGAAWHQTRITYKL